MKLSELKQHLSGLSEVRFTRPDGTPVPNHFHVTEAGLMTKHFIDCGGTIHTDKTIVFQVWVADDYEHRLEPNKLKKIIGTSETLFGEEDLDVEVEYQTETVGRYGLDFNGKTFLLTVKQANCSAKETCGIPGEKKKVRLFELQTSQNSCCIPGGTCC